MRIWAIANQKGGVGKTTTTLALGRGLAALGHRVLLIDLDPHASLSRAFGVPVDPPPAGVLELFGAPPADLSSLCHASSIQGPDYVCAQSALATLERRSANQPGLGLALQNALARHQGQHDYILLDCAPTLGLLMINALAAADRLIIPTQAEPLALHGRTAWSAPARWSSARAAARCRSRSCRPCSTAAPAPATSRCAPCRIVMAPACGKTPFRSTPASAMPQA